jgi:hypothetical protein
MKILLGLAAVIGLIFLAVNNPSPQTYGIQVEDQAQAHLHSRVEQNIAGLFSGSIAHYVADHSIRTNYIFFSVYHTVTPFGRYTEIGIAQRAIPISYAAASKKS